MMIFIKNHLFISFFSSTGIKRPSMNKSTHIFLDLILRKVIIPNLYLLLVCKSNE